MNRLRLPLAGSLAGHAAVVALLLVVVRVAPPSLSTPLHKSFAVVLNPPPAPGEAVRPIEPPAETVEAVPPPAPAPPSEPEQRAAVPAELEPAAAAPEPDPVAVSPPVEAVPAVTAEVPAVTAAEPVREPGPKPPAKPIARPPPKPVLRPREPAPVLAEMPLPMPPQPVARLPAPQPVARMPAPPAAPALPLPAAPAPDLAGAYRAMLSGWFESHKRYPDSARERAEQGAAVVHFRVDRYGRVLDFQLLRSTGYPDLDGGIADMLRGAQLPAFPAGLTLSQLDVSVTLRFSLTR